MEHPRRVLEKVAPVIKARANRLSTDPGVARDMCRGIVLHS